METMTSNLSQSSSNIVVGIDPGWSSCGVAINVEGKRYFSSNFIPKDYGTPFSFVKEALVPTPVLFSATHIYIERFVAYAGVHSNASEEILLNIGALCFAFEEAGAKVNLVRAIDWKQRLCKYLVRTKAFNNPYPSFDKKFSILAAQSISGDKDIKSDHEADAICLSYMKEVDDYESTLKRSKTTS